nr:MAG TPA: hypothetical protein [Caudoviricetes sp.]
MKEYTWFDTSKQYCCIQCIYTKLNALSVLRLKHVSLDLLMRYGY